MVFQGTFTFPCLYWLTWYSPLSEGRGVSHRPNAGSSLSWACFLPTGLVQKKHEASNTPMLTLGCKKPVCRLQGQFYQPSTAPLQLKALAEYWDRQVGEEAAGQWSRKKFRWIWTPLLLNYCTSQWRSLQQRSGPPWPVPGTKPALYNPESKARHGDTQGYNKILQCLGAGGGRAGKMLYMLTTRGGSRFRRGSYSSFGLASNSSVARLWELPLVSLLLFSLPSPPHPQVTGSRAAPAMAKIPQERQGSNTILFIPCHLNTLLGAVLPCPTPMAGLGRAAHAMAESWGQAANPAPPQ